MNSVFCLYFLHRYIKEMMMLWNMSLSNKRCFITFLLLFLVCEENKYGTNCSETCDCNEHQICKATDGCSECITGWTGVDCMVDIIECDYPSLFTCPDNQICSNNNGSYDCICDAGFSSEGNECVGK